MSPGTRYLNLLRIEYEDLIKAAEFDINHVVSLLSRYVYTTSEQAMYNEMILKAKGDIRFYKQKLAELGGAENGKSNPTEFHKDSESPIDKFTGVSCTTVM